MSELVPVKFGGECPSCGFHTVVTGAWLRHRRQRAHVSLREMAKRVGFSVSYLCHVERERRRCPPSIRAEYEALLDLQR